MHWIDAHIHVSVRDQDGTHRGLNVDDLLAVLDGSGADLRYVVSCDLPEVNRMKQDGAAVSASNRMIRDLVCQAPDRLFGSCTVNPHFLRESLASMDDCFGQWGFVQFGEMLQYLFDYEMDSPPARELCRKAGEFGVPVQVHVSTGTDKGRQHMPDLLRVADDMPDVTFIAAHCLGGVMSDYYIDTLVGRRAHDLGNLWIEVRDFNNVPALERGLDELGPDRLIAGTDWTTRVGPPFQPYGTIFGVQRVEDNPYPPSVASLVGFLREAGAGDDDIERVAWRNAAALYRLTL